MNSKRDIQGLTIKQSPLPFLHMPMFALYHSICKKLLRLFQPKVQCLPLSFPIGLYYPSTASHCNIKLPYASFQRLRCYQ